MIKLAKNIYLLAVLFIPLESILEASIGLITNYKVHRVLAVLSFALIISTKNSGLFRPFKILTSKEGIFYFFYFSLPLFTSIILQIQGSLDTIYFSTSATLTLFSLIFLHQYIYFADKYGNINFNKQLFTYLIIGGCTSIIGGILFGTNNIGDNVIYRSVGLMRNPNHFGYYLGSIAIVALTHPVKSFKSQITYSLIIALPSLLFILKSGSRSAIYALIVSFLTYHLILLTKRKTVKSTQLIIFASMSILFLAISLNNSGDGLITKTVANRIFTGRFFDVGDSGRLILGQIAFKAFLDNPIIGVGLGNFVGKSSTYFTPDLVILIKENLRAYDLGAHNEFIRTAAEGGILCISSLLFFCASTLTSLYKLIKKESNIISNMSLCFFCLLIYNIIFSLSQDQMYLIPYHLINGVLITFLYHTNESNSLINKS